MTHRNGFSAWAFALVVGLAVAAPASAQQMDRPVSDDGSSVSSTGSPGGGTFFRSSPGTGRELDTGEFDDRLASMSARDESAADVWSLWALEPKTAPLGTESIIGPDQRRLVRNTTQFPFRAVVLITFEGSRCTGWMISPNTVATAGHCVHSGGRSGRWYNRASFRIYPGRNGPRAPYGACRARQLFSVAGWTSQQKDDFDYGAIKLNCTIGTTVGWFGMFFQATSLNGLPTIIAGYPGDKPLTMWRSTGRVTVTQARRIFYKNDTVGGMSGSAVYYNRRGCGVCAMAIHAYGIYGRPPFSNNNHGTRINRVVYDNYTRWRAVP